MTEYTDKGPKPAFDFAGFDHLTFWVGNAKQASLYYCARFGFEPYAYRGLETGTRDVCTHVVKQGKMLFAFSSQLQPSEGGEMGRHAEKHGDGVKDVAFTVAPGHLDAVFTYAKEHGAEVVQEPTTTTDEHGTFRIATVKTYGDTVHSFVDRAEYTGFMPGFTYDVKDEPMSRVTAPVGLEVIDHVVGNQGDGDMTPVCEWYEQCLQFHRFWSVDDTQVHTEFSSLRSIVVADYDEVIKMPINEPADGLKKSQIQEYVDFYGGAGVQHIACKTSDIIKTIGLLRERGVTFLSIPNAYYDDLKERLAVSATSVAEDMAKLQEYGILVDFDEGGYLLQIFTQPVEDRPSLFLEVIERHNHSGFGAGNFSALFRSLEIEQGKRGNM